MRFGLEVIRLKLGENVYRFVMRFARTNKIDPITSKKLNEVGSLCGLNTSETEEASTGSIASTAFPFCFVVLLGLVAGYVIFWVYFSWQWHATYTPDTLYASLSPNDFDNTGQGF